MCIGRGSRGSPTHLQLNFGVPGHSNCAFHLLQEDAFLPPLILLVSSPQMICHHCDVPYIPGLPEESQALVSRHILLLAHQAATKRDCMQRQHKMDSPARSFAPAAPTLCQVDR
jgi:hypothetical protein